MGIIMGADTATYIQPAVSPGRCTKTNCSLIQFDNDKMKFSPKYMYIIPTVYILSCCNSLKLRNTEWASKIEATTLKNLYKMNDSIYRSEQPESKEFQDLQKLGIKSILNLRDDRSDTSELKFTKLNYYQIKIVTANFSDSEIVAALKIIKNSPKPLLVHCKHGSDRTGVVTAIYRIIFENWTKQKAIDELKNGGFGFHTRYGNIPKYLNNVDTAYIKSIITKSN